MMNKSFGRPAVSPPIVLGALIIKHKEKLGDIDVVETIKENPYMQFFIGLKEFNPYPVFDPSLFVEIRKRVGDEAYDSLTVELIKAVSRQEDKKYNEKKDDDQELALPNKGKLKADATVADQYIAYPTDNRILNQSRKKLEGLIDQLYLLNGKKGTKPRTYRRKLDDACLDYSKKKKKSNATHRKMNRKLLEGVRRDIAHINKFLDGFEEQKWPSPLTPAQRRMFWIINTVYDQQKQMFDTKTHSCPDRIASIFQPHVRPIPRGKTKAQIEFGSKLGVSLDRGFARINNFRWDAYHEAGDLIGQVEDYKRLHGHHPELVQVDGIYATRENRRWLKERNIRITAPPLGRRGIKESESYYQKRKRKKEAVERNHIEAKFGQGKNGYNLNKIRAKLKETSESWLAYIHVRFHSWCPLEAAFIAADHEGIYLQPEAPSWANQSTTLGDGKAIDKYIYDESERMIEEYGNHYSFVMMAYGNEPGGDHVREYLTEYINCWKNKDNRRIYTSAAGWSMLPVNEFQSTPRPRIQDWGEELNSIINSEPPRTDYDWSKTVSRRLQPIVSHEIGQWCVYPNFDEIDKYDGVFRAKNFEIFRETLEENGMKHLADSFVLASGKLQAPGYKADIEAALRTKGLDGFQLLALHDFPGQGTALVGVLDAFRDQKGYITPEEYQSFCNQTVPLARMDKRIFTNTDTFKTSIEEAHYGEQPIKSSNPKWKLTGASGEILDQGELNQSDIPIGSGIQLGEVSWPLHQIKSARKLTFTCSVGSSRNAWDIWVYPEDKPKIEDEGEIRVLQKLNPETVQYLKDGGQMLLNLKEDSLRAEMGGNVEVGYSSIFWNTAWTESEAPHTLGILCDPEHEAIAHFPTQYHSNWQWCDAVRHSGTIKLNEFSKDLKPIVRVIDDWFTNRPLGLIFEANVGKG